MEDCISFSGTTIHGQQINASVISAIERNVSVPHSPVGDLAITTVCHKTGRGPHYLTALTPIYLAHVAHILC